jgi:hypothetical protein
MCVCVSLKLILMSVVKSFKWTHFSTKSIRTSLVFYRRYILQPTLSPLFHQPKKILSIEISKLFIIKLYHPPGTLSLPIPQLIACSEIIVHILLYLIHFRIFQIKRFLPRIFVSYCRLCDLL